MTNLQQQIDQLQAQLDDLKSQLNPPKKLEMWKPYSGTSYYFIDSECSVRLADRYFSEFKEAGNCFPTKELAEHYSKKRAARQRLEMLALAANDMKPYEFVSGLCNFHIRKDGMNIAIYSSETLRYDTQYFPDIKQARQVLDAMSNEDLITLFGVGK